MTDLLVHGGRVHVGDGTSAAALLARDGRVVATGAARELGRQAPGAERVDLRGGVLVPGWTDAHVHFLWWSIQRSRVDLRDVETLDAALDRIGAYARRLPPDAWILGGRFDKNRWGRWPTAGELDRVSDGRPAVLQSRDGHSMWLNTKALEIAGITRTTESAEGGRIERSADGSPSGILLENAKWLASAVVPPPTRDENLEALRRGQREAWARGVTGVEDLEESAAYEAWRRLHDAGELGLRVAMGIPYRTLATHEDARRITSVDRAPGLGDVFRSGATAPRHDFETALATGLRTGDGDEWLRIGHLKIFTDGALGSQTAALEEPYEGSDDRGILTIDPAELDGDVARAASAGLAVAIHAIGDRAVRVALDAIEPTRRTHPALRQRVEHLQLLREADIRRFGTLGVIASMQPIHATSDRDLADRYWGDSRASRAYPWRSLLAAGARLAFGSDAPVEPIDPLLGIHAAVARKRPGDATPWHAEQALTLDESLAAYSAGAAYAVGREDELGTFAPGMRFDATAVDRDLAALPPEEWLGARVIATIVGGVVRFADGAG